MLVKLIGTSPQVGVFVESQENGNTTISVWPDKGDYELWKGDCLGATRVRETS
jgi:hypothetical protein